MLLLVYQRVETLTCCCVVAGVPESGDTDVLLCVVDVPESGDTDVLFCG